VCLISAAKIEKCFILQPYENGPIKSVDGMRMNGLVIQFESTFIDCNKKELVWKKIRIMNKGRVR
jgi:hypothetical protein